MRARTIVRAQRMPTCGGRPLSLSVRRPHTIVPAVGLSKPLLACWVIALASVCGACAFVASYYSDSGHSREYLEGAVMVLATAIPASIIVTVVSTRNRRTLSRAWFFYLNIPSALCAMVIFLVSTASSTGVS